MRLKTVGNGPGACWGPILTCIQTCFLRLDETLSDNWCACKVVIFFVAGKGRLDSIDAFLGSVDE